MLSYHGSSLMSALGRSSHIFMLNFSHPYLNVVCSCGSWSPCLFYPPPYPPIFPHPHFDVVCPCDSWSPLLLLPSSIHSNMSPSTCHLMLSLYVALGLPKFVTLHHLFNTSCRIPSCLKMCPPIFFVFLYFVEELLFYSSPI